MALKETARRPVGRPGLGGAAFEQLLSVLDADRDRAGERYEVIRRKLLKFFEWRGCQRPDELADQTIDRVLEALAASGLVGEGGTVVFEHARSRVSPASIGGLALHSDRRYGDTGVAFYC